MNPISLGREGSEATPQHLLRSLHEAFAEALTGALSTFLQSEIGCRLESISFFSDADFRSTLPAPAGAISFQLEPRAEQALLYLDCPTVFALLELLLGGTMVSQPGEPRSLTEIEWTLLEEIVRVLVQALGEAWKPVHTVEFKVLALKTDAQLLPLPDPAMPLACFAFVLQLGDKIGTFQIAVPQSFFETGSVTTEAPAAQAADFQRNAELLGESMVELRVMLEGPSMELGDLASLRPGQIVRFDYALDKTLQAIANDCIPIPCQMVSTGRKRAFMVEQP